MVPRNKYKETASVLLFWSESWQKVWPSDTSPASPAPPLILQGCWMVPVLWACVGLIGSGRSMWPPGEIAHINVSPLLAPAQRLTGQYS